ncbi:MAG: ATP-binding protein [Polyangiales bacterium]
MTRGLDLRTQIVLSVGIVLMIAMTLLSAASTRLTDATFRIAAQRDAENVAAAIALEVQNGGLNESVKRSARHWIESGSIASASIVVGDVSWRSSAAESASSVKHARGDVLVEVWPRRVGFRAERVFVLWPFALLMAAATMVVLYFVLTRLIVRPVGSLRRAAERLAQGNLDTHVPITGAREISELAVAFNRMAEQLRNDRNALEERLHQLEATTRELDATQEQLIRSSRLAAVGQLAAGVAHEIGNPLTAIRGLLELSELEEPGSEALSEYMRRLRSETERIHRIIRDLLDFSRAEPLPQKNDSTNIRAVVDETIRLLRPQQMFRSIAIEFSAPEEFPNVCGSSDRLSQVLLNVLLNAAQAIGDNGRIEIELEDGDDVVLLRVVDDGPGIDASVASTLFDPFVTTKPAGDGTGLGLSVCYAIVDALGGSMRAFNRARGACFEFRLPKANP